MTLLLCDVDNLKELNDVRGHHGGDWALKAVASTLRTAAEALPATLVCRLSGDEFAHPRRGRERRGRCNASSSARSTASPATGRRSACRAGIASTRLGPCSAVRAPARRRRRALHRQAHRPRPRRASPTSTPDGAWRSTRPPGRPPRPPRRARGRHRRAARPGRCDLLDGPLRAAAAARAPRRPRDLDRLDPARLGRRGLAVPARRRGRSRRCSRSTCAPATPRACARASTASATSSSDYPRTAELLAGGGSLHLYAGRRRRRPGRARAARRARR